jgi:hypothetical protein
MIRALHTKKSTKCKVEHLPDRDHMNYYKLKQEKDLQKDKECLSSTNFKYISCAKFSII